MKFTFKENNKLIIFLFSLIIILPKWIYSFYELPGENIDLKIINNINDIYYLPLISNISDFLFDPTYSNKIIETSGFFSFPILNFVIISIFYKIFGSFGFILLEIVCSFLFLYIFFRILIILRFNEINSFLISLFLFTLPIILYNFSNLNIGFIENIYINFSTFYSLRFPRPILTNLFLFYFLYLCLVIFIEEKNTKKNYLLAGLISGISLHLFYYFFIFQNILFLILHLIKFKKNFFKSIITNKTNYFIYSLCILLFLFIYIININLSDLNYTQRLGVVELNLTKKLILLKYSLYFLLNKFFISLFIVSIFFFFFNNEKRINFLFVFSVSTIISMLVFNIFSSKYVDIYHFYNWILTSFALFNLISLLNYFFLNKFLYKFYNTYLIYSVILLLVITLNINYIKSLSNKEISYRLNQNEITSFVKNNKKILVNKKFLVIDHKLFIWLSMNKFDNFSFVPENMWTVRSNNRLENDIISLFKFFNLNKNDFSNYISNKKSSFRMYNNNAMSFLGRKYLANKLYTFQDSDDFNEIEFIKNIKPSIGHSFAIPNFEFKRLLNKFNLANLKIDPDILILEKNSINIFDYKKINNIKYCIVVSNEEFVLLIKKNILEFKCISN